jgi:predicted acyltransferase
MKKIFAQTLALLGLGMDRQEWEKSGIWMPINKHLWTASFVLVTTVLA